MFFWKNIISKSIFEFFSTFYEGEIIRLYFAEQREFRESIEKYMNDQEQWVNENEVKEVTTIYISVCMENSSPVLSNRFNPD